MKKKLWIVVVLMICFFIALTMVGRRATLITLEPLTIHQEVTGVTPIAQFPLGTRLAVLRCVDTKSLIIPEVEISKGRSGYAVFGRFMMEYTSIFDFSKGSPVVFSCP